MKEICAEIPYGLIKIMLDAFFSILQPTRLEEVFTANNFSNSLKYHYLSCERWEGCSVHGGCGSVTAGSPIFLLLSPEYLSLSLFDYLTLSIHLCFKLLREAFLRTVLPFILASHTVAKLYSLVNGGSR